MTIFDTYKHTSMSELQAPGAQAPIAFQSKFAARKAAEDKAFMGLYNGNSFPKKEQTASGDLKYQGKFNN